MTSELKLFMVLLGCKPNGRHVEQHDVFFGIGSSLKDLTENMSAFWPDSGKMHIDAWREVTVVEDYRVDIFLKQHPDDKSLQCKHRLFFVNLGGYQEDRFEEQHYMLLTVKPDKAMALKEAKQTLFYQNNHFKGAVSHIDDNYGIDVDELYEIEDILASEQKEKYQIVLTQSTGLAPDAMHLGYLLLNRIK